MSDKDDFVQMPPWVDQAEPSSPTQQKEPSSATSVLRYTREPTSRLDDQFLSFAELEKAIAAYSSANFVQLWKRDASTIEAAKKQVGKIANKISDVLKYQSIKYCCAHLEKKFKTKASL